MKQFFSSRSSQGCRCALLLLFTWLLALDAEAADAYTYTPFVREGKVWNFHRIRFENGLPVGLEGAFVIRGDTLIGDVAFKKLLLKDSDYYGDEEWHYYYAIRESGRQVFSVEPGQTGDTLLYDFSQPYSKRTYQYDGMTYHRGRLHTRTVWGREQKVRYGYPQDFTTDDPSDFTAYWYEGVGAINDIFVSSSHPRMYRTVSSCIDDGKVLIDDDDYMTNGDMSNPWRLVPIPLLEEGKKWNYSWDTYGWSTQVSLFIEGDTIVDGRSCKKLFWQEDGKEARLEAVLCEEDGRSYRITGDGGLELLYDFTLKEGDHIDNVMLSDDNQSYSWTAKKIDTVDMGGRTYQRFLLEQDGNGKQVTWVEGIGSNKLLTNNCIRHSLSGDYSEFVSCELDGDILFTADGFTATAPAEGYDAVTLTQAGISTYCSDHDLDFSGTEGLKAYIASGYDQATGTVLLTRAEQVPAGTGIVVMGGEGTRQVPWAETGYTYANMLCGVLEPTEVPSEDGGYRNYILADGADGVLFYQSSGSGSLPAHRAYLRVPVGDKPLPLALPYSVGDSTTGVSDALRPSAGGSIYSLSGQRVSSPRKGLYVRDGKKVLIP